MISGSGSSGLVKALKLVERLGSVWISATGGAIFIGDGLGPSQRGRPSMNPQQMLPNLRSVSADGQ